MCRPSQPGLVFEGYSPDARHITGSVDLVLQADCGTGGHQNLPQWTLAEVFENGTQQEIMPHPSEVEGLY